VAADCFSGDTTEFTLALDRAQVPSVPTLKPNKGSWAPAEAPHTPTDAARALSWGGPDAPGDWTAVTRHFRDGHAELWWAAEATLAGRGPEQPWRLVVATTDPATLPERTTWYLRLICPAPAGPDRPSPRIRRPIRPRSCGSTGCAGGWNRAASKSKINSVGPTSRSAPIPRSAGTGRWCAVRFVSAGANGSPTPAHQRPRRYGSRWPSQRQTTSKRGGPGIGENNTVAPSWPVALRAIRNWLTPAITLHRRGRAWSAAPPPARLQALLDTVGAGHGLRLYLPP
jgi:hypothetical protein